MTAQKGHVNIVNALGVVGAYANAPHMKEMLYVQVQYEQLICISSTKLKRD